MARRIKRLPNEIPLLFQIAEEEKNKSTIFLNTNDNVDDVLKIGATYTYKGCTFEIVDINGDEVTTKEISVAKVLEIGFTSIVSKEFAINQIKKAVANDETDEELTIETLLVECCKESSKKSDDKTSSEPMEPLLLFSSIPAGNPKKDYVLNKEIEYKSKLQRFEDNIKAIRLLKTIQSENRLATEAEQQTLSLFTGWGGLLDYLDGTKNSKRNTEELLTDDELDNAQTSALTAFYTPYFVIKRIWEKIKQFGFTGGKILDPACGTSRFFQAMPEDIKKNSTLVGIDLDKLSAALSENLLQSATIKNCGFEKTNYIDNTFDLIITNVPFGEYSVSDKKYNKYNFKIHDYFLAKSLDLVRPGGLVVAITSHYTMDKKNSKVRKYLAQRAEFIGAVRLPNNTFRSAHTGIVSDILFFKKRMSEIAENELTDESWLSVLEDKSIPLENPKDNSVVFPEINKYFIDHKENIIGDYVLESTQYGYSPTTTVLQQGSIETMLAYASENIYCSYSNSAPAPSLEDKETCIEVPEELLESANFSYVIHDDKVYYRNDGFLNLYKAKNKTAEERIRKAIVVKEVLAELMTAMQNNLPTVEKLQFDLNRVYDDFTEMYGRLNSRANSLALRDDVKYPLLCSLEIYDENNEFIRKADIFTKRTINPYAEPEPQASNATDALNVSISKYGCVDFEFMSTLTGISKEALSDELERSDKIFTDPATGEVVTADEYLSGYVRDKLDIAKQAVAKNECYSRNVAALEKVQPKELNYNEIYAPLGANWIKVQYYEEFLYETFQTPNYNKRNIQVRYIDGKYYISNKSQDYSVNNLTVYGTPNVSGLELLEDALNFINTKVYDKVHSDGKDKYVVNPQKTQVAQSKQEMLRQAFKDWVWKDFDRRQDLVHTYNHLMNNIVEREYNGDCLTFEGMSSNITLKPHQKNAVARGIFGGNTLLAHTMGAGKTFEMIAIAMESKRLGLCSKSLIVVPNHLVTQWAAEFLRLYPFANILVSTKRDFEKNNRKKFLCKIATGDFDAIIISYSQFKKIPLSVKRQRKFYEDEMNDAKSLLSDLDIAFEDTNITVKQYTKRQYEIKIKNLEAKIKKMIDIDHDDVITFEELGCDRLFIDEAHNFKNLAINTKINNVAGLQNANSQRAYDLYMKVRYINKGVIFATGTPVSNAICELYVLQKYLQEDDLEHHMINSFDEWVGRFAETENKIEVKPEGTGYRSVVRLCKYHNLPELMTLFRQVADIKPADSIELDTPEVENINVAVEPSKVQTDIVKSFAERAEKIRNGKVDRTTDNMLCVTNDGRKLAIDQRLYDDCLEDDETSKLNECIRNVYKDWRKYSTDRSTQLVFCDMSTPKKDCFNVYDDIKSKLINMGVPETEIAFIHDAKTDEQKKQLYDNMNAGIVRILIGSTEKLGAGTNVQKRLISLHNIDCPWRPSDLSQREGRIVRPGNDNKKVYIYNYVTKNTFDTYLYQTVETKARFIAQIMTAKISQRDMEDVDTSCLNYAEIKALSTGNPAIKEKMELESKVSKLKLLRSNYQSQKFALEENIKVHLPQQIEFKKAKIENIKIDIEMAKNHPLDEKSRFSDMTILGTTYTEKSPAAEALQKELGKAKNGDVRKIGNYRGFELAFSYDYINSAKNILLISQTTTYRIVASDDKYGNIMRINNAIASLNKEVSRLKEEVETLKQDLENSKKQYTIPFPQEEEYQNLNDKLIRLNQKLALEGQKGLENII